MNKNQNSDYRPWRDSNNVMFRRSIPAEVETTKGEQPHQATQDSTEEQRSNVIMMLLLQRFPLLAMCLRQPPH